MDTNRGKFVVLLLCMLFLWPAATSLASSVEVIALPAVIFSDTPVDRYEQRLAAEAFLEAAAEEMRQKGYDVVLVTEKVTLATSRESAQSMLDEGDALAIIRIVHYLDAGFNEDTRRASYLEVYASGQIYRAGSGELLWEGEGHGTSDRNTTGISSTRLEISMTASEVMRTLFKSLPPAGSWASP